MAHTAKDTDGADGLLPMASPARDVAVSVRSPDIVVGSVSLNLQRCEQIETATQFRFGITETPFQADVEHKQAAVTGPHVVRFHEAGDRIQTQLEGAVRSTWIVISPRFLEDVASATSNWRAPFGKPFRYPRLTVLAALQRLLARAKAQPDVLRVQEELATLLPDLLAEDAPQPTLTQRTGMIRLAREVDAILTAEYATIESLSDVAKRLGVSASYLTRAYRMATGGTLHARLTRLRIAAALARLAAGAKDLTALALDLGYSSHSHFSADFKRTVGRPPSDYRLSTQI
jgi:AraC-like DNA-binding protein